MARRGTGDPQLEPPNRLLQSPTRPRTAGPTIRPGSGEDGLLLPPDDLTGPDLGPALRGPGRRHGSPDWAGPVLVGNLAGHPLPHIPLKSTIEAPEVLRAEHDQEKLLVRDPGLTSGDDSSTGSPSGATIRSIT